MVVHRRFAAVIAASLVSALPCNNYGPRAESLPAIVSATWLADNLKYPISS